MQVLACELNHLKQQHKALRQTSQLCCFACRSNLSLFSDVGPLEAIAETRTEVGSKARPAVAKSSPTAAKLGCAFSHSAERMVDELAYCTLKTVFFLRRTPSWLSPSVPGKRWKFAEKHGQRFCHSAVGGVGLFVFTLFVKVR